MKTSGNVNWNKIETEKKDLSTEPEGANKGVHITSKLLNPLQHRKQQGRPISLVPKFVYKNQKLHSTTPDKVILSPLERLEPLYDGRKRGFSQLEEFLVVKGPGLHPEFGQSCDR